jgi:hypothetical protein
LLCDGRFRDATITEEANAMSKFLMFSLSLALVGASVLAIAGPVEAGPKSGYSDSTRVKGYAERRGGYSYSYSDSINTYGDSRSLYGSASAYRDPNLDKQTNAGPFDHGFFFDSGVGARGGDSPYMN